jgi:tetratricopeptide (TPR) repeat protein
MSDVRSTSEFVNRSHEVVAISEFLRRPQLSPRIEVWSASSHSGLTHFLKYCSRKNAASSISLYADGSKHDGNTLFGQFGVEFYGKYPAIWRDYIHFQEHRAGRTRSRGISAAITASIPYVGRTLARGIELAYPTLSYSAYPSIAAEVFCEFLIELSAKHQVCMFLDNVQELDSWSADLLSVTVGKSYRSIRYVAGFVSRNEGRESNADEFALRSKDIGYDVGLRPFARPDEEFIRLYASAQGVQWPQAVCRSIAAATSGDIYKIRAAVAAAGGTTADFSSVIASLPPAAASILSLLSITKQDIRRSDVLALSMDDSAVFVEGEQEIAGILNDLSVSALIGITALPDGDQLVSLRPSHQTMKDVLQLSLTETTRQEMRLYDYFSRVQKFSGRHSPAEVAPLLYRLAKRVALDETDARLRDIIHLSLQMGSRSLAEEFVDRAITPSQESQLSIQDYLAKLAFLISVKGFSRVLELTANPPREEWAQNRFVQIFRGIALNRRRFHAESEQVLAKLCETAFSLEELSLLVSYRMVGRIHANDIVGARYLYLNYRADLAMASNYGYFLRNGAEVFEAAEGVEILTKALPYHERNQDTFGTATTLCNRGAKLAQTGQPESGLRDVETACDLLEVFGVHHLGMVIGDLAHCFLYLGLYDQVEATCRKALRYMGKELPRAYTLTNLAAAQLLNDQRGAALETIESVVADAESAKVDRVRQKVYLNGALISLFAGSPLGIVASLCDKALQHPDRRNPQITIDRVAAIQELLASPPRASTEMFLSLYSPCSLFYWYQNPLEGLPIDFLSSETIGENTDQHFSM